MRVAVLGPLEVDHDGTTVVLRSRAQRVLLSLLALRAGRPVPADQLIDAVWGDDLPEKPASALQIQMSRLRRALPDGLIATVEGGYTLDVSSIDVDVARFRNLLDEGRRRSAAGEHAEAVDAFRSAAGLWRGVPFVDVASCAPLDLAATTLAEERLAALEQLYHSALRAGSDASELVAPLEQLVAEEPLRESFTELLMRALYGAGRPTDALRRYDELRRRLADELGLSPSPALAAIELAILTHDASLAPTTTDQRPSADSHPAAPLTSFVGRARELDLVLERCRDHRLVTVVGPGGAGKTRLVTELFDTLDERFDGRAWFVPLAEQELSETVPSAFAAALGLDGSTPVDPIELVVRRLTDSPHVVVVDNCEHVIDVAADVVYRLLTRCPAVSILATSRTPLMLQGERTVTLEGLGVAGDRTGDAERLFLDRAGLRPGESLDGDTVSQVCRLVEGWPLAIELIAANADRLDLDVARSELESRILQLATPYRGIAERHVSLTATLDWSFELLDDVTRRAYAALGLFDGPITRDGAAMLTAIGIAEPWNIVEELARRSLLTVIDDCASMLRPVVRHARTVEMLGPDESRRLRNRFVEFHLELTAEADRGVDGPGAATWLALIRQQEPNVVRAIDVALRDGCHDDAATIAAQTAYCWMLDSRQPVGLAVIGRLIESWADQLSWTAHRDVLQAAGFLHGSSGQWESAREHLAAALEIQERHDDPGRIATLGNLANVYEQELRLAVALDVVETARALLPDGVEVVGRERVENLRWSLAVKRSSLLTGLGRYDQALVAADEAVAAADALGGAHHRLGAMGALAEALLGAGRADDVLAILDDLDAASRELDGHRAPLIARLRATACLIRDEVVDAERQCRACLEEVPLHDAYELAAGLRLRAEIQLRTGDRADARLVLGRCLEAALDGGSGELLPSVLLQVARLLGDEGRSADAATLLNAVDAIQDRTGCAIPTWIDRPTTAGRALHVDADVSPTAAGRLALDLLRRA